MTTIAARLSEMKTLFAEAGLDSPEADARILLQDVLKISREEILLDSQRKISVTESEKLNEFTARRLKREPVSRILGHRAFWKSDFRISPETLDPRADSETLIEAAVKHAKPGRILDLGTGSGCLLLSLLQEWPGAEGVGIDISRGAVATAEENAKALGLSGRSKFIVADWEEVTFGHKFDVVISNPPYIADGEMAGLASEVTLYDPRRALVAGADGLDCYRSIVRLLPRWLNPEGYVLFEIGHTQGGAVKDLLEQGGFTVLQTKPDLAGNDRCLVAQGKPQGNP